MAIVNVQPHITVARVAPHRHRITVRTGPRGEEGRRIELQTTQTHIQWRYLGDPAWTNLIALSAITGAPGAPGAAGADGREVQLQASSTHIQWRYSGVATWTNLVPLADLVGPPGEPGINTWGGIQGNLADQTDLQNALNDKLDVGAQAADVNPEGAAINAALGEKLDVGAQAADVNPSGTAIALALNQRLGANQPAIDVIPTGTQIAAALAARLLAPTGSSVSGANLTLAGSLSGMTLIDAAALGAQIDRLLTSTRLQTGWDGASPTNSGSGGVANNSNRADLNTGGTANSRAQLQAVASGVYASDTASATMQFNRRITISFTVELTAVHANSQFFLRFGAGAAATGNLSGRGMGIRINNTTLVGQVHNGSLTTSATLATLTASRTYRITIQSNGAGSVQFWLGNTLLATMTGGPTTTESFVFLCIEALNGATASTAYYIVSPINFNIAP